MSWKKNLDKLKTTSRLDRRLLLESGILLVLAHLAVTAFPFRWITPFVGQLTRIPTAAQLTPLQLASAQRLAWAVRVMANRLPVDRRCLVRSLAAKRMLRLHQLPGVLYLGMAKSVDGQNKINAHAWVRSSSHFITGESGSDRFTIIAMFE